MHLFYTNCFSFRFRSKPQIWIDLYFCYFQISLTIVAKAKKHICIGSRECVLYRINRKSVESWCIQLGQDDCIMFLILLLLLLLLFWHYFTWCTFFSKSIFPRSLSLYVQFRWCIKRCFGWLTFSIDVSFLTRFCLLFPHQTSMITITKITKQKGRKQWSDKKDLYLSLSLSLSYPVHHSMKKQAMIAFSICCSQGLCFTINSWCVRVPHNLSSLRFVFDFTTVSAASRRLVLAVTDSNKKWFHFLFVFTLCNSFNIE